MDKWQHTMCWIEWLHPLHFTSSWYFFLDFLTLLSTLSCLCMSLLQWEMRGQSVDTVCCSPQRSAETAFDNHIWRTGNSLVCQAHCFSHSTHFPQPFPMTDSAEVKRLSERVDGRHAFYLNISWDSLLYDDVLTRRSEMPDLFKAFALCNKVII